MDVRDAGPLIDAADDNVLVHGLVSDLTILPELREKIRTAGLYGHVSLMPWNLGSSLPYADNLVNEIVIRDAKAKIPDEELIRVLAPRGFIISPEGTRIPHPSSHIGKGLVQYTKPANTMTDEWTHIRYNASGNATSKDQAAGPPNFLKWEALPRWNRGTKTSSLVTSNGRIFYIMNDGHFASLDKRWWLIARDAYNGIELWRHELPKWPAKNANKKIGPAQTNRRLVAIDDRIYASLGGGMPISVLNAVTGKILRTFNGTEQTEEFIVAGGIMAVLVNLDTARDLRFGIPAKGMELVGLDPDTGEILWKHKTKMVLPLTVASDGKQVVFHDGAFIKSLDLKTGDKRWISAPTGQEIVHKDKASPDESGSTKGKIWLTPQFAPTLIMYEGVVAFAGGRQLNVFSASDGKKIWQAEYAASNYSTPVDLFGFDGYLWGPDATMNLWRPLDDDISYNAYDLKTGEIRKQIKGRYNYKFQHHRCYQMKAVDGKIVSSRAGIEFLDTDTGDTAVHHWLRGSCHYGILPANGLLYVPPHNCACYIRAKLTGFNALASGTPKRNVEISDRDRLIKGKAFGKVNYRDTRITSADWPTYRNDISRSGRTEIKVGQDLLLGWNARPGGTLSSPVIANGQVYVVSVEDHRLHVYDASNGNPLWTYDFDARVDSPPTVVGGLALAGCRDGSVHALRAEDGELAWRFRAAPQERLIVVHGQLESVWPINGSILVVKDTVYVSAGRSSYLDSGIRIYGLDLLTGKQKFKTVLNSRDDQGSETLDNESVTGYLNDILSCDGKRVFMRHNVLDLEGKPRKEEITHLFGPDGYLSANTTSRLLWTYAPRPTSPHQGAGYDYRVSRGLYPSGIILVEGEDVIYGYGQNYYDNRQDAVGPGWLAPGGGEDALFCVPKGSKAPKGRTAREYLKMSNQRQYLVDFNWWTSLPIRAWAMVKTTDLLYVAGSHGSRTSEAALKGNENGGLMVVSPTDGKVLKKYQLPAIPAWDGMAAADKKLFLTLANGQVVCLWMKESEQSGERLPRL